MTEEIRSGRLDMPLVVLEADIDLHLNSAQASLDTQQVKYARKGLLSAAIVSSYSKLALTYAEFVNARERERFQQYMELATRLINAYWQDFGLTLLKSAHTEEPVAVRVQEKTTETKPPPQPRTKAKGYHGSKLDRATYKEMLDMLFSGEIDRYETKQAFFREVATMYGLSTGAVTAAYYSDQGRVKTNGR